MNTRTFRALLALALLPLSQAALAAEAFDNCTGFIESLPTTISTQGTWCLRKDLSTAMTSGNAISVNTANVTIDCNGFKLGGLPAGDGTLTVGINAFEKANTVVRNCTIRGFHFGAKIGDSAPLVEDNRFEGNTSTGLQVIGAGGIVRRNLVLSTGGSTQTDNVIGIETVLDTDVIDNTVDLVAPRAGSDGFGFGIRTAIANGASITGNRIRNVFGDGTGEAFGIAGQDVNRLTVTDNQVIGAAGNGTAISCDDAVSVAKDNTIAGFATALTGCDDDGGNLIGN